MSESDHIYLSAFIKFILVFRFFDQYVFTVDHKCLPAGQPLPEMGFFFPYIYL